jgi:hypothetical protein
VHFQDLARGEIWIPRIQNRESKTQTTRRSFSELPLHPNAAVTQDTITAFLKVSQFVKSPANEHCQVVMDPENMLNED